MDYSITQIPFNSDMESEEFDNLSDAITGAVEASYDDNVWGVWDDQDDDPVLLHLVFQQRVFSLDT